MKIHKTTLAFRICDTGLQRREICYEAGAGPGYLIFPRQQHLLFPIFSSRISFNITQGSSLFPCHNCGNGNRSAFVLMCAYKYARTSYMYYLRAYISGNCGPTQSIYLEIRRDKCYLLGIITEQHIPSLGKNLLLSIPTTEMISL
jgi:hypothetical protein